MHMLPDDNQTPPPATTHIPPRRGRDYINPFCRERCRQRLWTLLRPLFVLTPARRGNRWRVWLLNRFGAHVDPTSYIAPSVRIVYPWNLVLERHVHIEPYVVLECADEVFIGAETILGRYTRLSTQAIAADRHDMVVERRPVHIGRKVRIDQDVYIAPGAIVEDGSVLLARASVFDRLEAGETYAGNPSAKVHIQN